MFYSLLQMDVASAMEMQPMGSCLETGGNGGFGSVSVSGAGDMDWAEADVMEWFPVYVEDAIRNSHFLSTLSGFAHKLRFVESVVFATVVLLIIVQAAWPAFQ